MSRPSLFKRIGGDARGSTMAEFAVLAPTMLLLIMGSMDLAYRGFVTSVLEGEMQKAARDSGLEDQNPDKLATIEAKVKTQVGRVVKNASFGQLRKSYTSYLNAKPERFTDSNNNGQRDAGECFDDVNANGQWDPDPGRDGQGGANDVTVYSMTLTYPRLFPMYRMLGWPQNEVITARTYLKNQPYKTQTAPVVNTICT